MKKYFLKTNGKRVNIGDTVTASVEVATPFGKSKVLIKISVTEDTIPILVREGILKEKDIVDSDIRKYIRKVAERFRITYEEAYVMLANFLENEPSVALMMLLKEISNSLSPKQDFSKLDYIWVISMADGKIHKVSTARINNFEHFAPFCRYKDAEYATEVLADILEKMYGKQKDS